MASEGNCHVPTHGEGMILGSVIDELDGGSQYRRCGLSASFTSEIQLPDPVTVPPAQFCSDRKPWLTWRLSFAGIFTCQCPT